jgi:hypothetical protein
VKPSAALNSFAASPAQEAAKPAATIKPAPAATGSDLDRGRDDLGDRSA